MLTRCSRLACAASSNFRLSLSFAFSALLNFADACRRLIIGRSSADAPTDVKDSSHFQLLPELGNLDGFGLGLLQLEPKGISRHATSLAVVTYPLRRDLQRPDGLLERDLVLPAFVVLLTSVPQG